MKKALLFSILIAFVFSLNAQTIALHSASGVQIFKGNTALASAYTVAQNTDTLYLSGGTFVPPAFFDKQLTIFGAGHYVDSTLTTGKTFINGTVTLQENADLFHIEGLEITGNLTFTTDHSVNNVKVIRCKLSSGTILSGDLSNPSTNLALIGNVFVGSVVLSNATNVMIASNFFQSGMHPTNGNQITNNIFFNSSTSFYFEGDNNQLDNNIFFTNLITSGSGNVFKNNLFISAAPNYGTTPTVIGSYINVPQANIFVDQTGAAFNYDHNYHLQAPATYVGTDGSEVGIYGGIFPYKEGAVPTNPHIQTKNISAQTNASGELNVDISVGAQNN